MPSRHSNDSVAELAARGAVAGLVGGLAMVAAERLVLPRLPDRRAPRVRPWEARVGRAARQLGVRLSPGRRTTVAVSTQLAAAALLGAGYYVARERMQPDRAGRQLLEAGLAYGISLLAPELPRTRVRRRRRVRGLRTDVATRRLLSPITPPSIFARTATLALRALAR